MATTYTKNDVRKLVESVQIEAQALGLIDEDTKIVYGAGSPSNGISATLDVTDGERHYIRVEFLPEFTYKQTAKDQYKVLHATWQALAAMRRHFG